MKNKQTSSNMGLVKYFVREFQKSNILKLECFVSPSFYFKLHSLPQQEFDFFAARMNYIFKNAILDIGELSSNDDITFCANTMISVSHFGNNNFVAEGLYTFTLTNGLISSVEVKYDFSDKEFEKFQTLLHLVEKEQAA